MVYRVRSYVPSDASVVADIFAASVRGLAGRCYNPEQVKAWSSRAVAVERVAQRCADGRTVWVAVNDADMPVAFIDLKQDGQIDMLYCHPDHARRGLASLLYVALEQQARDQGLEKITARVSACGKPGFEQWGFETLRRNDFDIQGVAIHNFVMEKEL